MFLNVKCIYICVPQTLNMLKKKQKERVLEKKQENAATMKVKTYLM